MQATAKNDWVAGLANGVSQSEGRDWVRQLRIGHTDSVKNALEPPRTVADLVGAEAVTTGPLAFSTYMNHALYHPSLGFYANGGAGRHRDFITSVEVGPLFGAMVALAIDAWWVDAGRPEHFDVVEVGAGPGTLARTVMRSRPDCAAAMRYLAVESSEAQRRNHPDDVTSLAELPEAIELGFIFANELLDNLVFDLYDYEPTRGWSEVRIGAHDGQPFEVLVATEPPPAIAALDMTEAGRIPDHVGARSWLTEARNALGAGAIVAIDYAVPGYPVDADRAWLRTYADQQRGSDPLDAPGHRDITIDVPIDQLASVQPPAATTQASWLRSLGIDELVEQGRRHWQANAAAPDLGAIEARSRVREAEALLDPDGLGGFSVLSWTV